MNAFVVRQTPMFVMAVSNGMQNWGSSMGSSGMQGQGIAQWLQQQSFSMGAPSFVPSNFSTPGFLSAPLSFPSMMKPQMPGLTQQFGQQLQGWGGSPGFSNMGSMFQNAMQSMMGMFQTLQQAFQMQTLSQQFRQMAHLGGGMGMRFGGMPTPSMPVMNHGTHNHSAHNHGTAMPGHTHATGQAGHTHTTGQVGHTHGAEGSHNHSHGPSGPPIQGAMQVNGQPNGTVAAGQPTDLTFNFTDPATGKPITEFDKDHGKHMHAIVVSEDLSSFSHIHPTMGPDGKFHAKLNSPTNDPDNQDAQNAISKGGKYMVFGEVSPKGQGGKQTRFDVNASGPTQPVKLTPDKEIAPGVYQKYFNADGSEGGPGAPYQVTMTVSRKMHEGKPMMHFDYNVKEAQTCAQTGKTEYKTAENMENWLGMPGHGVLIGANGASAQDRVFRHMHAGGGHEHGAQAAQAGGHAHGAHDAGHAHGSTTPQSGDNLSFMLGDKDIPPSGTYKMWGQFKHKGKVLTFPFTFNL
ncbi:MAG: hypothetical protein EP343_07510 [Deltaproteobacteria bacterium]|nr:MAG: hypothetical protein EP343_07510 [Deltaproteobacteria bacterium]